MMREFIYQAAPSRVIFGAGTLSQVSAEVARLGCKRAFLLSTAFQAKDLTALAEQLGPLAAGQFNDAAMHTPVAVTEKALAAYDACGADCIVALGGGSTIGLGKAIAWRNDAPQIVVATTYAGSEVTDILGQTKDGEKSTVRDPKIRPEVVIYDPALTTGLPVAMSVASGLNAMAHAVEGLYAPDGNPVTSLLAVEGIRALRDALPAIVTDPTDINARSAALYGSWLCGVVLGSVAMSLHHKLCHTLGGTCDLPHAETHAILLPHTAAYNAPAARDALAPAAALFGGDLGGGLHDLARALGAPLALKDLGLARDDIAKVAGLAVKNPYANPRDVTRDGIEALLTRAYEGARPES
ncbi:Alcohol dehydrogenase, class IV [Loktanella sp. DSM 29012]|uniref:maleylacetate reductase n=1 Tax=Loktanella sp. DSM 29012 TaxID=1881056 RepID=UPI0008C004DE|nr:maleylacetate reductase [Loktanella sp. DSM 29012]SEQ75343.1 Alcohol dehydrogenase, class IV [Loktanella sp. DSM 29012]